MSHRQPATDLSTDPLSRALRALPLAAPEADGWASLAASLRSQRLVRADTDASDTAHRSPTRRRRDAGLPRRWMAAALAAGLGVLAIAQVPLNRNLPQPLPTAAISAAAATSADPAETELADLRNESSRIEEWLRTLKADETPLDGRNLMAATEIEDMIGLIDLQLAAGSDRRNETAALWRSRVELLRDLAAVRTTYSLAGTGVAANGTAATLDNLTTL